jgi:hypothetical protein
MLYFGLMMKELTIWELKREHMSMLRRARGSEPGSDERKECFRQVRLLAGEIRRRGYKVES